MTLLYFVLAAYALSSIIVEQGVFEGTRARILAWADTAPQWQLRKLGKLLRCMFCTGFWVGLVLPWLAFEELIVDDGGEYVLALVFVMGLISAATTYLIHVVVCVLEKLAGDALSPHGP